MENKHYLFPILTREMEAWGISSTLILEASLLARVGDVKVTPLLT